MPIQETMVDPKVAQLKAHLDAAETAYRAQDAAQMTEHVNAAIQVLEQILAAAQRADVPEVRNQHKRLVAAHRILRNLKLKPDALPQMKFNFVESGAVDPAMQVAQVSFQHAVAPLLANKCGRCHVSRASGGVQFASATDLNALVFPGDPSRSYLYEIVENNTMPQGNNKLTADEKALLKLWIEQGGRLDPGLADLDLRTVAAAPAAENPDNDRSMVPRATETDTVFFSRDVAPLLVASCQGCHLQTNQLRNGLSLDNFTRLMQGGGAGPLLVPGEPENSLLIKKLRGQAEGQRMPLNRPAWSDQQIELVSTWIREGAKYDGFDPTEPTFELVERSRLSRLGIAEINALREQQLQQAWRLALVDQPYQQGQTDHFLWIAGAQVDSAKIDTWLKSAEQAYQRRRQAMNVQPNNAFAGGKILVLIPESNYDFSEMSKLLSRREVNTQRRGYWQSTLMGPYLVLAATLSDQQMEELLPNWIGSAMVANLAPGLPVWFCDTLALALNDGGRGRERAPATNETGFSADQIRRWLGGQLPLAEKEGLDQAMAAAWRKQRQRLPELLTRLQQGERLETLLQVPSAAALVEFISSALQR
jgi:mono/diheme cytochrome c family protein